MSTGPDSAGEFADGSDFTGAFEAFLRATELIIHERELEAERGRLGVYPVAAADAGRHLMFLRAPGDRFPQRLHVRDEDIGALDHLDGEGGVHDVAAGEAEMEPAAGAVVDLLGDGGGKTDDVMVEGL